MKETDAPLATAANLIADPDRVPTGRATAGETIGSDIASIKSRFIFGTSS